MMTTWSASLIDALCKAGQKDDFIDPKDALPIISKRIDQAGSQCSVPPDGDDRRHIADLTNAQHALSCTDGVQIAHAVTHDDHMVGFLDRCAVQGGAEG